MTAPIRATINVPNERAEVEKLFTLEDVDPVGRTEVLIYSPPGSGKTVFASTFPGPQRWISADGETSLKSIRWAFKMGMTALASMKDLVAYVPAEEVKGRYIGQARAFNQMQDMIDYWFKEPEVNNWQTLVLDSFSEINQWALDLGLGLNMQYPAPAKPLSTSDKTNRAAMTRLVVGQQDYKSAMGLCDGFLRNIRSDCARHGKNLVVLCHEYKDTAEGTDGNEIVMAIQPWLIGQLRTTVTKSFDDVWHMEKYSTGGGVEIKVRMHGDNKTVAKSRWGNIMPREVKPDFREMIEVVKKFYAT